MTTFCSCHCLFTFNSHKRCSIAVFFNLFVNLIEDSDVFRLNTCSVLVCDKYALPEYWVLPYFYNSDLQDVVS